MKKHLLSLLAFFLLVLIPAHAQADDILDFMPVILAASNANTLEGQWNLTVTFADSSTDTMYMNLAKVDGNWVTCEPGMQEPVTVDGNEFSFVMEGYTFTGTIHSNNSISGTWDQGTWEMAKTSPTVFCGEYEPWDPALPLPKFVTANFTEVNKISEISRFRSGAGHDYSDDYETCRSMKHYYSPNVADWSTVNVFSPVDGQIIYTTTEWAGTQVHIQSTQYPSFIFILFHVDLAPSVTVQTMVTAGQDIGNHIGNQTMQDIAVKATVREGEKREKLVSFFDLMTDDLFATYNHFSAARTDFIISKEARDADPLTCDDNENFISPGTIPNYVTTE